MKNLVVWGAGYIGKKIIDEVYGVFFERYRNIYFFDNDRKKQGEDINDIYVLRKEEFEEMYRTSGCDIIIATDEWKEIYKECTELNIDVIGIFNKLSYFNGSWGKIHYSQEGEELFLLTEMSEIEKGYYVDIGAHHPFRFSNTYWAYKRGWNGINIEPNPKIIPMFEATRKRDINECCGIAEQEAILEYYMFEESAFNTFCRNEFEGKRVPEKVVKVPVRRLDSILEKYHVKKIDFMSIDVEGLEMEVLSSNNWGKFRPKYILVEQKGMLIEDLIQSDVYIFLKGLNYKCVFKSLRTAIYKEYKI